MSRLQIPPTTSTAYKLAKIIFEEGGQTQEACLDLCVLIGVYRRSAIAIVDDMIESGLLVQRDGLLDLCIRLKDYFNLGTPAVAKPTEIVPPRRVNRFTPEMTGYDANLRRNIRAEAAAEPMRFYTSGVSAGAIIRGVKVL